MSNKLVSIAMATYNGEKYLREQLDSIYNQTYKNIEVVVCDDCSTDGTVKILEEYKQQYGLRYYINEKNLGYSKNFEKAASLCNGEFITFSDQDDIWIPEKIEILIEEIKDNSLIHSDAKMIDQFNNIFAESSRDYFNLKKYTEPSSNHVKAVGLVSCVQGCTIMCQKELFKKAFPIPFGEEYDFWLGFVASKEKGIKYLGKQLVLWRVHEANTTNRPKWLHKLYMVFGKDIYRRIRLIKRLLILNYRSFLGKFIVYWEENYVKCGI